MKPLILMNVLRMALSLVTLAVGTPVGLGLTAGIVFGPTPAIAGLEP